MSDRSASLLTKTQRRRLDNDFEGVDGTKRRRDRQKIRDRVAAGLADVEYLAEYPDGQLELALDDLDDEELAGILADTHVLAERIRLLRNIDRDVIRQRADHRIDDEPSNRSTLALRDEMTLLGERDGDGRDAGDRGSGDFGGTSAWMRRGDALLKWSLVFLIPAVAIAFLAPERAEGPTGGIPAMLGSLTLLSGLVIVGVRALKENVIPLGSALLSDPTGAVRRAWERI